MTQGNNREGTSFTVTKRRVFSRGYRLSVATRRDGLILIWDKSCGRLIRLPIIGDYACPSLDQYDGNADARLMLEKAETRYNGL